MKNMKFILCCFLIFICASLASAEQEWFTEVRFYEQISGDWQDLGATSYGQGPMHKSLFYIGKNSTGIQGSLVNDNKDVIFEAPFVFYLVKRKSENILYGTVYGINYENDSKIASGAKKIIDQPFDFEKENIIPFGILENGNKIAIGITVRTQKPRKVESAAPITMKTVFFENGVSGAQVENSKYALEESTVFRTGSSQKTDKGIVKLKYSIKIIIKDLPEKITEPFKTELILQRAYSIDTDYYRESKFRESKRYTSEFSKNIELIPGQTLLIVFPPDTPSVHGFDIEDTLIIRP